MLSAAETAHGCLANTLPLLHQLKQSMVQIGRHQESQDKRLAKLEVQLQVQKLEVQLQVQKLEVQTQKLEVEVEKLDSDNRDCRGTIMLGQLAYKLCHILEHYEHGPDGSGEFVPLRMQDLVAGSQDLEAEQRARWEEVVQDV